MTEQEFYKQLARRYSHDNYAYPSTRYNKGKDITTMDFNNTKINVDGIDFKAHNIEVASDYHGTVITATAHMDPFMKCTKLAKPTKANNLTIENVIFNPPATIVFWSDKTKTIVKADYDYESYDPEKGIAMAITKKLMGDNKGHYYELFKHWRKKWDKQNEAAEDIKIDIPKSPINELADSLKKAFTKPTAADIDYMNSFQP